MIYPLDYMILEGESYTDILHYLITNNNQEIRQQLIGPTLLSVADIKADPDITSDGVTPIVVSCFRLPNRGVRNISVRFASIATEYYKAYFLALPNQVAFTSAANLPGANTSLGSVRCIEYDDTVRVHSFDLPVSKDPVIYFTVLSLPPVDEPHSLVFKNLYVEEKW